MYRDLLGHYFVLVKVVLMEPLGRCELRPLTCVYDIFGSFCKSLSVKMMVLLGEVGGVEEYKIVNALKEKKITKPLIAWCIGTCADYITSEVGASADAKAETAAAKNEALREAGAYVPTSFDDLGTQIAAGVIEPKEEQPPPAVPMDYAWA
uniref:ATP citrate synthase n=1 Tax=Parascaris equorum TaxID=6256 RepID=A0A914RW56_PAREQ